MTSIYIPDALIPLFTPLRGNLDSRTLYGGRGSAKSMTAAQMALLWGACEKLRVLCVRQFQNSIKESFFAELKNALDVTPALAEHYEVTSSTITSKVGTEFLFRGLDRNLASIKSLAGIDLTIAEEAEQIGEDAWRVLMPTIMRQPKSEVWVLTNPKEEDSATDVRFVKNASKRNMAVQVNYTDNQFFPQGLEVLRLNDLKLYPESVYRWIWHGEYLTESEYCVYRRAWFEDRHVNQHTGWDAVVHSWDTAYKTQDHNDPSACTVWGIKDRCAYLINVINLRMDYPVLRQAVIDLHTATPATTILIEDKSSGQALLADLQQQTSLPVLAILPQGDKRTRAVASTQLCCDGRIILPRASTWLSDYEKQLFFFTGDPKLDKAHDDMVDSTSQFINWFRGDDNNAMYEQQMKDLRNAKRTWSR